MSSDVKPGQKLVRGKESIANKRYEVLQEVTYENRERLALTQPQKDYLEQNGLVARYLKRKEYLANNNFHRSNWKVVQDPDMPGANADGEVIVGDLVLGVKTKEGQRKHREALERKNRAYSSPSAVQKKARAELESAMREGNVKGRIHEGYEENKIDSSDDSED